MSSNYRDVVTGNIERTGLHVQGVFPTQPNDPPPFAYTIGLTERNWPELLVIGLPPETGGILLNLITERFAQAETKPQAGMILVDIIGFGLSLRLDETYRTETLEDFVTQADNYYGRPVPVLQVVWPDADGRFPEEAGFDPNYADIQDAWR